LKCQNHHRRHGSCSFYGTVAGLDHHHPHTGRSAIMHLFYCYCC